MLIATGLAFLATFMSLLVVAIWYMYHVRKARVPARASEIWEMAQASGRHAPERFQKSASPEDDESDLRAAWLQVVEQIIQASGRTHDRISWTCAQQPLISGSPHASHPRVLAIDALFDQECSWAVMCAIGWQFGALQKEAPLIAQQISWLETLPVNASPAHTFIANAACLCYGVLVNEKSNSDEHQRK